MSSKIKISRRLEFDAGHRVMNHESKCATLHGHRYVCFFEAEAEKLDSIGRVIDFSILKEKIGSWLDHNWDHTCLIFKEDKQTLLNLKQIPQFKPVFECQWNPTAENMADYLLNKICPELLKDTGVTVTKVTVYETPNCYAEAIKSE